MKIKDPITRAVVAVALISVLCSGAHADTREITGFVEVIDGDTLRFPGNVKVRILGLDTLEKNQKCDTGKSCSPCGEQSKAQAIALVGKSPVSCKLTGQKTYDREVGICTVDGKDYAGAMIAAGWGLAYRQYLPKKGRGHAYVAAEEGARTARLGIWATTFIQPADWRNHKMRLQCEMK